MRLLLFVAALTLDAQSLVTAYLGLNAEQLAAIARNGRDYESASQAPGKRFTTLLDEIHRETTASPLNVTRLDILHTELIQWRRDRATREAAVVAANQAVLTPTQAETIRNLERDENLGYLMSDAFRAALAIDSCGQESAAAEISPALIEHLRLDVSLSELVEARNAAFAKSLETHTTEYTDNSERIRIATIAPEIDIELLGRLYAAQIAIAREIAARRKLHASENRTLLPANVLEKLQRIETVWKSSATLSEARDMHLVKIKEGLFYGYGPSCQ